MRVLHLISTLGGGGAERQLVYLAGGQQALGFDVHVAIFEGGPNLPLLEATGTTVHRLLTRSNYDPRILLRLLRLFRRIRPDLVQTWLTQMDVFGGAAALLTRTPWVISERASGPLYTPGRQSLRSLLGRGADAVVANSEVGLEIWKHIERKHVIPNAVPLDLIEATPRDESDFGAKQVILFAGRFEHEKNVLTLIAALREVLAQRDAVALLCGAGTLEREVRAAIAAAGLTDRIRLLGFRDNLASLMKRADVLVAPSRSEGHPNVSLEAAASGCPLVVSDIAGHRGFLDDDSAILVPVEDAGAFAKAILSVLDDPGAARLRAMRARELILPWSVERCARSYAELYCELIARRTKMQ